MRQPGAGVTVTVARSDWQPGVGGRGGPARRRPGLRRVRKTLTA